jgi:hypothetical protein
MSELTAPGPMVEVEWFDSGGQAGWHDSTQSTKGFDEQDCRTLGYLIEESERGVCLVMGFGGTGMHMDSMTIPRANVVKVTRLRR